mgnify:CR=1 FL=1
MSAGRFSLAKVYFGAYRWMRGLVGADVVEKTGLRRNQCRECMNRPLHAGTSFDKLYIVRYRSADVNILGSTRYLARKLMRISV